MQLRCNKRLLREVAPLVLNNIGYVPTALHVWHLLKNAKMTPVNVTKFKKRLSRETWIETITAIYFCITTVIIALAIFKAGVNDWIALAVFAFFTIGAISRSANLVKAYSSMKANSTPEQCMEITEKAYKLDYKEIL